MKVLLIDNIDSFTYNVAHLLASVQEDVEVVRYDDPRLTPALLRGYEALVIGPGPGRPSGAPATLAMLDAAIDAAMPTFGVCLGLQAIGEAFGGTVVHAPRLMHGKVSKISHDGSGIFADVPNEFVATRYHSLCLDPASMPTCLHVSARSDDGVVQGIAHRSLPIHGVQFHPESILSEYGTAMIQNFFTLASLHRTEIISNDRSEL